MPETSLLSTVQYINSLIEVAEAKGVYLEIGTDFTTFRKTIMKEGIRTTVAPVFDPDLSDVSPANAFWIIGVNDRGDVVHTQAARMIDLSGVTLSDHLAQYLREYWFDRDRVDMAQSRVCLSPTTSQMTGKLCYHGELWLKAGRNNLGGSLTAALMRLLPAMGSLLWSPDYFLAFVTAYGASKGLMARGGYTHLEQGSIFWHLKGDNGLTEDWLSWMDQQDLEHMMKIPPEHFDTWYRGGAEDVLDAANHNFQVPPPTRGKRAFRRSIN
ncbi:MAG: hypothetical protein HN644_07650 [Rhodospirillales bacterium]|jgi:hypothetical protein|nr:hypothetical protein [Rhodospirillales bacterium]MBT4040219.1 hypothetical protein [Rhodospirillales bacterium]MBT4627950.1 hypothetical protein [Rhodospirillales bacterium]MBT5350313.1 hypothetical protein [Rhodospirillales bacterium]MBT5521314.1 hypothetical protein [Rhodospirillales bacterium]